MGWHDLYLVLIAAGSELLGTISGFGSSTFFLPLAVRIENFNFVLILTALLHIFGNVSKLYLFRKSLDFKIFVKFAVPSLILSGFGAFLSRFFSFEKFKIILGLMIVALSILLYFKKKVFARMNMVTAQYTVGASGFLTGLLGTGGVLRGIALASLGLEKSVFVALSSGIDLGGDILRACIYMYNGYFDWSHWFYIPMLIAAGYVGSFLGQRLLNRMSQEQFEKIVLVFVLLSGLLLVVE